MSPAIRYGSLVQQEPGHLSLVVQQQTRLVMLRCKLVPGGSRAWQVVQRELRLSLNYLREQLGVTQPLEVVVLGEDTELIAQVSAWWSGLDGVQLRQLAPPPPLVDADAASLLGPARLLPLLGVIGGSP